VLQGLRFLTLHLCDPLQKSQNGHRLGIGLLNRLAQPLYEFAIIQNDLSELSDYELHS
jgi:hypothetical protein